MSSNLSPTTIDSWLKQATQLLTDAYIETARLDALLLLCDEIQKDKSYVFMYPEKFLQIEHSKNLDIKLMQRASGLPLAYVRGNVEFYGRTFFVDESVLVPRPDSEAIIELYRELQLPDGQMIADIGCGSGCLGITVALEFPDNFITLYDIDTKALQTAEHNGARLHAPVSYKQSNMLEHIKPNTTVILANLPYIPEGYPVSAAVAHEPAIALYAGSDGLDAYRTLFAQVPSTSVNYIITESLLEQHSELEKIAQSYGFTVSDQKNLIHVFCRK